APIPSENEQKTLAFTTCYGISGATQNPEAAMMLVNFLNRPDIVSVFMGSLQVPSRTSATPEFVGYWYNYAQERGSALTQDDIQVFADMAYYAVPWKIPIGASESIIS
ncbi:MAG TPA: hypothetical protein PLZ51_19855, partial [Aggregatilineales bacterium]|nr:hypothetical protein [Aggregatilineales bacterium]